MAYHAGMDRLAPTGVWHTDCRYLGDRRMRGQCVLHLGRIHVLAGHDDGVLDAVPQEQIAVVVQISRVAHAQPTVHQRVSGGFLLAPVAQHHGRRSYLDLADLAGGQHISCTVHDSQCHAGAGQAGGGQQWVAHLVIGGRQQGHGVAGLGGGVRLDEICSDQLEALGEQTHADR
ncbi:MAG TPA: hypothetical protein VEO01_34875 [Pseudonocardiaceae bacterium]|nr:hypothetical protein [Pseudonocardiaceae bacterium]